jgi:hypothetical protein
MRITLLALILLSLTVAAQWALDPSAGGYRGWTLDVDGTLPTSLSATVQLLPTPYWQEWVVGNWTTAFTVGRGCTVQAGPLRYGIYVSRTAYVETPAVKLGQNFTVVAVVKPRYLATDYGWIFLWIKNGPYWFGEASATYEGSITKPFYTLFRMADASGAEKRGDAYTTNSRDFATLVYVGMYIASQDTYYMYMYVGGSLVAQNSFKGQRGAIASSTFKLGTGGEYADQPVWYVAFAVYNRSLSAVEVAAFRPEAPPGGDLVMYYYAHPQFVKDVDGDGVLEWLDLSGNGRHAELRGAAPQWFAEPAVLSTQQCGGVVLSAQWDGFTATYAVNGTQRSIFEPGRVQFDGLTGYASAPLTAYGWSGITVEQYIYAPPAQRLMQWGVFTHMGGRPNIAAVYTPSYANSYVSFEFTTRVGDPYTGGVKWYRTSTPTGRWQHVVMTYDAASRMLYYYVNGTLLAQFAIPAGEYTILDIPPSTDVVYQRLGLGAGSWGSANSPVAYGYVRVYSRALSQQEVLHNYQHPNSPVADGLELWLSWDSFRGSTWLDKSGKGRHASVYGTVYAYPHWQRTVGAYLQHGYPAASPLVVTDFRLNGVPWTSGVSRGGAVQLVRVDGAYIDAAAGTGGGWTVSRYAAPNAAMGFDAVWTPSDDYRGWITLWQVGATALNITQVGGHGASLSAASVRAYAGTAVAVLGGGLYLNGTMRASLPTGSAQTSFALLPTAQGGLRALVRYAWLDAGVRYGGNSSSTYGGYGGSTYAPSPTPSPWAYYVDFRWWPPVATWGILQSPPIAAVRQGQPSQVLTPVAVSGSPQVSASLWGPFGEVCLAQNNVAFGVRHVWLGTAAPTCVLPASYAASGSVQSALFNSTAPIRLYFSSPPVQHPYVPNSVPGARFCSLDGRNFTAPYLFLKAPGSTAVTDQWACAPTDYFAGGYVGQSQRGWALIAPVMRAFRVNTTSVVYFGSGAAVLAREGAVPALSVRAVDGRTWNIYTSGAAAVASAGPLQTPPNVSRTGGAVSAVFGVPRSPTTLVSQWWADGVRYYVSAAGLADAPVVYISSFTGSPAAVPAELNAPGGYTYYVGIMDNGTYVWAVPLTGPMQFSVYVPAPGYYAVRLYRGEDKVWEKNLYLSPDTKLSIGPVDIPVFTPVGPVSLYTPAAPKPPVFVPAVAMEIPPYAVGILMLGVFAAAYVSTREISLASLITGAVVAALGVLINAPIYGVAGVFLLSFGLWNKARRQGSS